MLTAPRDPQALAAPDEWWVERRVLARKLLDAGDAPLRRGGNAPIPFSTASRAAASVTVPLIHPCVAAAITAS